MGNRRQPFGYKMEQGRVVRSPLEARLVEHIFRQYISGATYSTLVTDLRNQTVPYEEGKVWNKNMVARILGDKRYTGENGYPEIIRREILERAQEKRNARQAPVKKTETQILLRRLSGHTSTLQMEQQVLNLLNSLVAKPERIVSPQNPAPKVNIQELKRRLEEVMRCQPIDEESAGELILALASAQYSNIGSAEYETARLRQIFSRNQPGNVLDAELLRSTVSAVQFRGGKWEICLKNGQIIGKAEKAWKKNCAK